MLSPIELIQVAQYYDATNNTRHLVFSPYFSWKSPIRLSTVMLQITDFFLSAFFTLFSIKITTTARYHKATNDMPDLRFFMSLPMNFAKMSQYHDATSDRRFLIFSSVFSIQSTKAAQYNDATNNTRKSSLSLMKRSRNLTKTARYQAATNNTRHLVFLRYLQWKTPKRLGTMMLQMTDFINNFHNSSHELHQNGSVPWRHN